MDSPTRSDFEAPVAQQLQAQEPRKTTKSWDSGHFADPVDPSIEFLYKPHTISGLVLMVGCFIYYAFRDHGEDSPKVGAIATLCTFLFFATITMRDGPFIRPHPVVWRFVLALGFAYQLLLTYMLFQDVSFARNLLNKLDPTIGVPIPEKSYAENCDFTVENIMNGIDEFVIAHSVGWFAKALILRDYWFCWILSIMFEVCEYSLQHQLPNFAECWWDHWILDVLICNWIGTVIGMKTCEYFAMRHYSWRGIRHIKGYRGKVKRAVQQFTPHSWVRFEWGTTRSFGNYVGVLALLFFVLLAELNAFYLKFILWIPPSHPINILRLLLVFLCALPAVREAYQYMNDERVKRIGMHAWLAIAAISTEVLICIKYDPELFLMPFPPHVVRFWAVFAAAVVLYPIWQFVIVPRWWPAEKVKSE
ncbi:hypothetical protein AMAG_09316 [Allomyces macrogynus ATCC 38327]|uniref:Phosphatidylserine synthase n=1 Tax=Allomyces macrogynus (strain ATCC 38327) TaxID=578462 RepID=A0A0L0SP39_ALLM3|nr:hypothetical protein AMAG_09316 [Allomyces macrogynus ATCC 38327]|eukprot:KNE64286.1 hypothetical protein AMAG_09316 [Allomyces macrogynus ATCC 38327]